MCLRVRARQTADTHMGLEDVGRCIYYYIYIYVERERECVWWVVVRAREESEWEKRRKKEIYTNCENIIALCSALTDNLPRNQFPVKTSGSSVCTVCMYIYIYIIFTSRIWKSKVVSFSLLSTAELNCFSFATAVALVNRFPPSDFGTYRTRLSASKIK